MTMYGKHHRQESIEKMRKSVPDYSGDKNPFFNKQHTEAIKANISEHKKSNWQTTEYRNKRIDWLLTDEAKQISINNLPKDIKGEKNGNWKGGHTYIIKNHDLSNLIPLCASYNSEIQAFDADKKEVCSLLDTWFMPKDLDNELLKKY